MIAILLSVRCKVVVLTLTGDSTDPAQLVGVLAAHLYCSGKVEVSKPCNNQSARH